MIIDPKRLAWELLKESFKRTWAFWVTVIGLTGFLVARGWR